MLENGKEKVYGKVGGLFANAGRKIKTYSKWLFLLELIIAALASIITLFSGAALLFFAVVIGSAVILFGTYISCLFLYAFGEIAENVPVIAQNTKQISSTDSAE